MVGKILKSAACAAAVLTLACGSLLAQSAPKVGHTQPLRLFNIPSEMTPAPVKLFSNLGPTPTNNYNDTTGYYVLGSANSVALSEQWIAIPFTNGAASHVTQIQTGIALVTAATNGHFTLSINNDDGTGTVGTVIGSATANATTVFGTCCTLTSVHFAGSGFALAANTQYWVVAQASPANESLTAIWSASNLDNIAGNVAQGGWFTFSANEPSVSVVGTRP